MASFVETFFGPGPGERKRARFRTDQAIRQARGEEAARLEAQRMDEEERLREVAKNIYLREIAAGGPDAQTRAEDAILQLQTSAPLATSAFNELNRAVSREGMRSVPLKGEAERAGLTRDIAGAEFETRRTKGMRPDLFSQAANAAQSASAITSALQGTQSRARMHTAGPRAVAEDVAATRGAELQGQRAQQLLPTVPQEIEALTSAFPLEIARNANLTLGETSRTEADIAQSAELARQQMGLEILLNRILQQFPQLSTQLTDRPFPITEDIQSITSAFDPETGRFNRQPGRSGLGRPTPGATNVLPVPAPGAAPIVRRRLGEPVR